MSSIRRFTALTWALALLLVLPSLAWALPQRQTVQATLTVLDGSVTVVVNVTGESRAGASGDLLSQGDRVLTGVPGPALITLADGTEQELDDGSEVRLEVLQSEQGNSIVVIGQAAGVTINRVAQLGDTSSYQLSTPSATALVRGTEFRAQLVRDPQTNAVKEENIAVQQGVVQVRIRQQEVTLQPGERLRIERTPGGDVQTVGPDSSVVPETGTIETSRESGVPGGSVPPSTPSTPSTPPPPPPPPPGGTSSPVSVNFDFSTGADVGSQDCSPSGGVCAFAYGGPLTGSWDGQERGGAGSASLRLEVQADGRASISAEESNASVIAVAFEGQQGGVVFQFAADPGAFEQTSSQPLTWRGNGTWTASGGFLDETGNCLQTATGSGTFQIDAAQTSIEAVSANPLRGSLSGTVILSNCTAVPPSDG